MAVTLNAPSNFLTGLTYNSWGITVIKDELYVSAYSNDKIEVYDLNTKKLNRTITKTLYYGIGSDETDLYMRNNNGNVDKIDKITGEVISTNTNIKLPSYSATFKIDLKNDRIYYNDYSMTLYIKQFSTGNLIKSYTMPNTYSCGVDVIKNKYVIITNYDSNKIYYAEIINGDVSNLTFTLLYSFKSNVIGSVYYKENLYITTYSQNIQVASITGLMLNETKFLLHDGNDVITVSDISAQYTDNSIPVMTSNTTPNGIVTCSKSNGSSYDAWYVFNRKSWRNGDSYWDISNISFPQWIAYEFDMKKIIGKYSLKAVWTVASRMPKDWTFEGSNDGTNWTVLDTQSGITWNDEEKKEFIINNINAYKKYRINITAIVSGNELSIDEIEMFEILSMTKNKRKIIGSYPPTEKDFLDNGMDKISSLYEQGDLTLDFVDKGQLGEGNLYECEFNAEELWEVNDFEVELE